MAIDKIAVLLAVIGALNWGGIGLFGFDAVAWLFGGQLAVFSRIIYTLVGLAGLWCLTLLFPVEEPERESPSPVLACRENHERIINPRHLCLYFPVKMIYNRT